MEFFKNLKTAQKIICLIGIMAVFILCVGVVGLYFTDLMKQSAEKIYKDNLLPVSWLNQNRTHIRANEANLLWLIVSNDPVEKEKHLKDIEKRAKVFNDNLINYEKKKLSEQEIEDLNNLKTYLAEYRDVREKVINLALNGKSKQAYEYFVNNIGSFEEATKYLVNLGEYSQKEAENTNIENQKAVTIANNIIIASIITALALAIILGLLIATMISKPLENMLKSIEKDANGNLQIKDVKVESSDEVGQLGDALNTLTSQVREFVKQVTKTAEDISANSEEMSASSEQTAQGAQQTAISTTQLAQGAQEISRNVEQGAANINKMNKAVQGVSEEAKVVAKIGNDTETDANAGAEHVKKAVNKIESIKKVSEDISINISELGKLSSEIEQIVDLIKNIAGQTNLLALNAAIEAARAGEHGKGFAVVADEVKKLAGQSAGATEKITAMIKEIQNKTQVAVATMGKATTEVEEGVLVVNDAGKALENIISQVKTTNTKIQGITKEIDGVAKTSEDMVKMIENISAITEETAASAEEISSITEEQTASLEEISASSQTLAAVAETLTKQVAVFKI